MLSKHLLGSFLVVVGFALAIFLLFLLFGIKTINPLFLLYLGLGAIVSFFLGFFILPKAGN